VVMAELVSGPVDDELRRRTDETLFKIFVPGPDDADPTPRYAQLHSEAPVHLSGFGGVVFSRYDDTKTILRDNRFGSGAGRPTSSFGSADPEAIAFRKKMVKDRAGRPHSMLALNPPAHTRQRGLVSRAFTPRRIESIRGEVARLVEERLNDLAEAGTADAMDLLAEPLPVSVISQMLGVPAEDWPDIRSLVTDLVLSLEPGATLQDLQRSTAAYDGLWSYFGDLVEFRRDKPSDDLLTALIQASDDQDKLSSGEVLAVSILLFSAGAETTTNLIGNGLNALFNHPDQYDRLWANPDLVPSAVEEILRYDSPVQLDGRICLEPAEVCGVRFETDDRLITLLGAANHDPDRFEDPDRFDIGREGEPVMSFGSGIHYCLGANLARMEGQEVFAGLIRRFASIEAAGDRPYRPRIVLRGLESCPVTVTPR